MISIFGIALGLVLTVYGFRGHELGAVATFLVGVFMAGKETLDIMHGGA